MLYPIDESDRTLRHIQTARSEKAINAAAVKGFRPLVKAVKPSSEINSKFQVIQNIETGKVQVLGDYRAGPPDSNWHVVIDWTFYYPHSWPTPFAAYLVPPDIGEGEWVILEDLIEDVIGGGWNQGDTYRLQSCRAQWINGDFVLDYDPDRTPNMIYG